MANLPVLPGQELEKAVAQVGSAAGLSIVSGLNRRYQAWIGKGASRDEAEAEETKRDIEFEGQRRRSALSEADRRQTELEEIDHRFALQRRALGRQMDVWEAEQRSVEWVGQEALLLAESDPERDHGRDLDDDWLRKFFKYAAEVDEQQVLQVLAQALADAANSKKPLVSAKALDTLRFFERDTLDMFRSAAVDFALFECLPQNYIDRAESADGISRDQALMIEMGLVKIERVQNFTLYLGNARFVFSAAMGSAFWTDVARLTHVGRSIAGLLIPDLRTMMGIYTARTVDLDIWSLQERLSLDRKRAADLAKYIVVELCTSEGLNVSAHVFADGIYLDSLNVDRKNPLADRFEMSSFAHADRLSAANAAVLGAFTAVFDDFDENTLPAIAAMVG